MILDVKTELTNYSGENINEETKSHKTRLELDGEQLSKHRQIEIEYVLGQPFATFLYNWHSFFSQMSVCSQYLLYACTGHSVFQ